MENVEEAGQLDAALVENDKKLVRAEG